MISGINSSSGITHAYRYNVDTVKERFCGKNEDFLNITPYNLQVHEFTENVPRVRENRAYYANYVNQFTAGRAS